MVLFKLILNLAIPVAVAAVLGHPARAQNSPADWFSHLVQPSAAAPVPAPSADAASQWSGQSGASGDPRMTANAIRAAAADFGNCLAGIWPDAERRGITRESYERLTAGLTPDLSIMDKLDAQPEFDRATWDYLDLLVTDERVAHGQQLLTQYAPTFAAVARAYGVDGSIIAAIWGVESNFGSRSGDRPVLRSTATLACVGRRREYFRGEFLAALEILQRGDIPPERFIGSWAGAFGPTQFMPTTFLRYAVDFDGNGHRDVIDSIPDMVASTANNLKLDGWVRGQSWGYEVTLPANFNYLLAGSLREMSVREWEHLGVRRADGKPFVRPADRGSVILPAGARGPAFLILQNFRVIMKYNPAEAYALGTGYLANRMRGGSPVLHPWPRDERMLTAQERYELQQLLAQKGYPIGPPDGFIGPHTRLAIRSFQQSIGQIPDGFASSEVLQRLRQP
jgi:membrane-bound lytic murein transglycosylase B